MNDRMNGKGEMPAKALTPQEADAARAAKAGTWAGERPGSMLPPAGQVAPQGGPRRTEFFARLKPPMENGTGKAPGAKRAK
jgi:hypothetical protein